MTVSAADLADRLLTLERQLEAERALRAQDRAIARSQFDDVAIRLTGWIDDRALVDHHALDLLLGDVTEFAGRWKS
jgi:hypothetical protein